MGKFKKIFYSQKVAPYVFVLPFILSLIIFWAYPLISGIVMSFQEINFGNRTFIGLANYAKLAKDKFFAIAVGNSVEYMLLTLLLMIPIPLLLAVLMESRITKAKGVWKVIMYIPALTSVVISGMLFRMMFSESAGSQMNQLMLFLGRTPIAWLKEKWTAWIALLLLCMWRWTGVNMLYFVSGLKAIDGSIYESADIDGANAWQKFVNITVPQLKPTTFFVTIMLTINCFKVYDIVYMLAGGSNGVVNKSAIVLVYYIYEEAFRNWKLGRASASALVLFAIVLVVTLIQFRGEKNYAND